MMFASWWHRVILRHERVQKLRARTDGYIGYDWDVCECGRRWML